MAEKNEEVARLQAEQNNQHSENRALASRIEGLEYDVEAAKKQAASSESKAEIQKNQKEKFESQCRSSQITVARMEEQAKSKELALEAARAELEQTRQSSKKVKELEKDVETVQRRLLSAQKSVEREESIRRHMQAEIERLQEVLIKKEVLLRQEKERYDAALVEEEKKYEAKHQELISARRDLKSLQKRSREETDVSPKGRISGGEYYYG